MYSVSESYNPYSVSRQVEIETQLRIVDEEAAKNAAASATSVKECSGISTIATDELTSMGGAYLTLEEDYLSCDRVYDLMPDDYHKGYWSDDIGKTQTITFQFSAPVTSMGLSLFFDPDAGVYPLSVSVQFHNQSRSVVSAGSDVEDTPDDPPVDVFPERGFAVLMFPASSPVTYSGITLTITPTKKRRVRLAGVLFGIVEQYRNNNIKSWDWNSEVAIDSGNFPSTSQSVTVLDDNGQFKLTDPSLVHCIHSGLRMKTAVIINGERVPLQDTLLTSVKSTGDGVTAILESSDTVIDLDSVGFRSSSSDSAAMWNSADSFLKSVLARTTGIYGATSTGLPYTLPADRKSIKFFPHRNNQTVRYWLCLIAQAIRCHIMMGRTGVISFVDVSGADVATPSVSDRVTKGNSTKITIDIDNRVNCVEIETGIVEDDESISMQAKILNKYSGETDNVETKENLLLTHAIGKQAADFALKQANRRITYKAEWRGNPALDLLDVISIDGNPAIITGLNFRFDGYFHGTVTAACNLYSVMQGVEIGLSEVETWNS